jgi:hypothetical protein
MTRSGSTRLLLLGGALGACLFSISCEGPAGVGAPDLDEASASKLIAAFNVSSVTPEDQYLYGDWNGDGDKNLAVRRGSCVYMDTNLDGTADKVQCYGNGNSQEYLVGDWDGDGKDNLAVRAGNCVYMDYNFDGAHDRVQCYGNGDSQQYLVGDWNGDGKDNLAVRAGNCVYMDYNFDGAHDLQTCYGNGDSETEYVAGDWQKDSSKVPHLALRRDGCVLMNYGFDGSTERTQCFGNGTFHPPAQPAPGALQYTLSTELKHDGCGGDTDADCLDNAQETALANVINPWLFLDEDEDCAAKEVFFQVRPVGSSSLFRVSAQNTSFVKSSTEFVDKWRPGMGQYYVAVTYFLNFFKDCNSKVALSLEGHIGDNEHITYLLSSSNLRTWTVEQGNYAAHGEPTSGINAGKGFFYGRSYLEPIAKALRNGTHPALASDEDGHGSYPGISVDSDGCAGNDLFGTNADGSLRDCFYDEGLFDDGHMGSAFEHGHVEPLLYGAATGRNIGEPAHWNPSVLKVYPGGVKASVVRNGVEEFFSNEPNAKFCGWLCQDHDSSGNCAYNIAITSTQGTRTCTDSMWGKIDQSCFRVGANASGTCQ